MRMSAMIKIENVSKVYGKGKKNQVQALKSIDLELEQGQLRYYWEKRFRKVDFDEYDRAT